ncbi:uncharacterized protein LOC110824273 [Carica papaya]|uniref:uncharacterized protein LOC110824273 n=1 Tax=Carica papaya TaxID=3649 RepID=UPI000B8C7ADE|nr:uncharacterized protein LOC110824273 [Carica papaya]
MKERGKAVELYNSDVMFPDCYSSSSDLPCKKHPSSSSVGICPYCLKDRLVKLVCSDCGEQRLSSCSCSEISSNRNSCTVEVGSVGRISFLIENERNINEAPNLIPKSKIGNGDKPEEVFLLKRSSSSCVEIKRKNGFWKIGKLFRKSGKREKDGVKSVAGYDDQKSDLWVVDYLGVSRSRSLCSFRGGGFLGSEDGGDTMAFSGARSSISAARSSSVNGGLGFDSERRSGFSEAEPRRSGFEGRKSGFSEAEPRKSGFESEKRDSSVLECDTTGFNGGNRRVFSLKETYFTGGEDSGFIDLKFDFPSESNNKAADYYSAAKMSDSNSGFCSMRCSDLMGPEQFGNEMISHTGSCRITVSERGIKKSRKSFKSWRWIFKHHPNWISGGRKKDNEDIMVNP